jgi:excisionase family DNA binding protein
VHYRLTEHDWRLAMSARRPVPAATLYLLAPTTRRGHGRAEARDVIDLTVRTDDRLLLTVEEAADRLGIGRSLMYELIGRGQIASIRVGRLRRVPLESLTDYVAAMRPPGPSTRPRRVKSPSPRIPLRP